MAGRLYSNMICGLLDTVHGSMLVTLAEALRRISADRALTRPPSYGILLVHPRYRDGYVFMKGRVPMCSAWCVLFDGFAPE